MANVSFLTGGDVAPIRDKTAGMFGAIAPLFQRADVSFFNLELPLSDRGKEAPGKITHRGGRANVEGLAEVGVSYVNLANNHILDYGDDAFFDTIDVLDSKAIGHFGAGRNLDEARKGHVVEKNGLRIGFLGYTTTLPVGFAATDTGRGVNPVLVCTAYRPKVNLSEYPGTAPQIVTWTEPADLQRLKSDVESCRKHVDVLIVYVHWGTSMTPHVNDFQREIARTAIDAGAHALFGGHQHVMSAIEFYKGRPIVHGSANLLFDTWVSFFNDETLKTFLFGATIDANGLRDFYLLPVKTGVHVPPLLLSQHDPQWKVVYEDLQRLSGALGTELVPHDDAIEVRCGK
jgi:poly-gamma-glutamate capsule biosynthesis protein CapA/YwtB (metallophosphatase superfamily)